MKKSEFTKNILMLMTGTTIAQAIPIAISPILTRMYTPKDFGIFALFVAIVSIFGSIANGRYELAIMLPKEDEDAINVMALGFIINILLSLFLLLIIIVFHKEIISVLNNEDISPWLYLTPFSVFLIGCFNLLNYFNNRKKFYKNLAKANIYRSLGSAVFQLGLGFFKAGALGLISGQIFSQIIVNLKLYKVLKDIDLFNKIKKNKIIFLGKKYKEFLTFSSLAVLINNLSYKVVYFFISSVFSAQTLGFYSLTEKILGAPSTVIGKSIGQVFFQSAVEEKNKYNTIEKIFMRTLRKLVIISILIFVPLFFVVDDLFSVVFGEEWREAGIYAKTLLPMFAIRFISSNLAITVTIFNKLRISLLINIVILFSSIIVFLTMKNYPFRVVLEVFSFVMSLLYLAFLFYYLKLIKKAV